MAEVKEQNTICPAMDIYRKLRADSAALNLDLSQIFIGYRVRNHTDLEEKVITDWAMKGTGENIVYFAFILNNGNTLILWDKRTSLDRLLGTGRTNEKQMLSVVMSSSKIQNIQSQQTKKSQKRWKKRSNEQQPTTSMPLELSSPTVDVNGQYFPRYPCTDDGFVQSFAMEDTKQWLHTLHHYGCVVLKVLSASEADRSVQCMFDELYHRTLFLRKTQLQQNESPIALLQTAAANGWNIGRIDPDNPSTWKDENFPNPSNLFLLDRPALCKQAFLTRCSDKMHFIFSTIYDDEKLHVSIDNYGISRGTKNLRMRDPHTGQVSNKAVEMKQWRHSLQPHWDINPWQYSYWLECGHYQPIYQGALALTEQRIVDGTHLTLPGSMNCLSKWCAQNEKLNTNPHRATMDRNDALIKYMQPIPLRKGEMVIWNCGQLHANTDNHSNKMRLSQYIRMFPAQQKYIKRDHYGAVNILNKYKREVNVRRILGPSINEKTEKLLGIKQW